MQGVVEFAVHVGVPRAGWLIGIHRQTLKGNVHHAHSRHGHLSPNRHYDPDGLKTELVCFEELTSRSVACVGPADSQGV